jgi:hypothetical protein
MGDWSLCVATVREVSDFDDEDRGPWASGLFEATASTEPDHSDFLEGPEGVPLEEALAWARKTASCVMVEYAAPSGAPCFFSAGERECARVRGFPRWPPADLELRPRRHPDWLHLDRSADDEPIDWDVKVTVGQMCGRPVPELAERMAARLGDVEGLDWIDLAGGGFEPPGPVPPRGVCFASAPEPAAMFRFTVRAATVAAAQAAAEGACRAALTDTLAELSAPRAPSEFDWRVDAEAYPLGSRAAFNAAISEG